MIDYLERLTNTNHVVIGITSKDISATNRDIPDWGVMGLSYCPVRTCLMRDAKGKNTTNEEKEFCTNCKSFLIKKGWNLQ